MENKTQGTLLVLFSAVGFGLMAIFVKLAYICGANPITVLAIRFITAALIMWVVVISLKEVQQLAAQDIRAFFFLALMGYGGSSVGFYYSLEFIDASLASMIIYIYPILVTLLELFLYRYWSKQKLTALLLSSVGLYLILCSATGAAHPVGIVAATEGAIAYAFYMVYARRVALSFSPFLSTAWMFSFAALGFTFAGIVSGELLLNLSYVAWLWILCIAIFSTVAAVTLLFFGMKYMDAGRASIVSSFEPACTIIAANLVFGERITLLQGLGGILVFLAIYLLNAGQGKINKKEEVVADI